jgi:hypothetical protein
MDKQIQVNYKNNLKILFAMNIFTVQLEHVMIYQQQQHFDFYFFSLPVYLMQLNVHFQLQLYSEHHQE